MTILEAWSYGRPVLMTSACNLPEGFETGAALEIETNPAPLSERLRAFFRMAPDERSAIGGRGRKLVERSFAWPGIAEKMMSIYTWLTGGGPRPDWVAES